MDYYKFHNDVFTMWGDFGISQRGCDLVQGLLVRGMSVIGLDYSGSCPTRGRDRPF